ncbi:unnamed protein product [Mytilus edulis]|uniref:Reverse transcriptase domain-containing protein n=1 Tax=Mytilus edulis TaxID=6550 RepID=A0A8S3QJ80_MYTED|nr:unnamed protein product [Mytilus edulis]
MNGYQWFGHNRNNIHKRAKCGSGGVGVLVRNDFADQFLIEIVESSKDGIMWIRFTEKNCVQNCFYVCVVYLPPENSTRAVNAQEFFDNIIGDIYTIPNENMFYLCGDWNSRCGDMLDYIPGVDSLPERNVVDFKCNTYGSIFCDFLSDISCCILNGRNTIQNDFTYVSTRGSSVVDYCIVPYEKLQNFEKFSVSRASTLVDTVNGIGKYDLKGIVPDHSMLSWEMSLDFLVTEITRENTKQSVKTKYDIQNIPQDFLLNSEAIRDLNKLILDLENSNKSQVDLDQMYCEFVKVVKSEMSSKLSCKTYITDGFNNKRRRCKKPWWNEELTVLWNCVCSAEKIWIKATCNKSTLRHNYVQKRKHFDKACQRSKRQYWYSMQDELKNLEDNPKEFWRKIGKIGVGNNRQSIPMEVKLEDNTICTDPKIVLDKWKCDFSNMLNSGNVYETTEKDVNSCIITDDILDSEITNEEVVNILKVSKAGKSPGCDEIPMEMYKNQTAINALTQVFNICYNTGMIPELWSRGIITPIPKSSTSDPRDPMSYRGITLAPTSYKLYCGVLNSRLTVKLDELNFIHDEQNGFRSNRSTIDHLSTITSIIETRKMCKMSTLQLLLISKKHMIL